MHETGIVRDLIRKLDALARESGAATISGVVIRLGALSGFSPEHFRIHFDEDAKGTRAAHAALTILLSEDAADPHAQDVMIESVDLDVPDGKG